LRAEQKSVQLYLGSPQPRGRLLFAGGMSVFLANSSTDFTLLAAPDSKLVIKLLLGFGSGLKYLLNPQKPNQGHK